MRALFSRAPGLPRRKTLRVGVSALALVAAGLTASQALASSSAGRPGGTEATGSLGVSKALFATTAA